MTLLLDTPILRIHLVEANILELIVNDHQEVNHADLAAVRGQLEERGISHVRVLVNRLHDYSTGRSLFLPPYPKFYTGIDRIAFVVYAPTGDVVSRLVADIAFAGVLHRSFLDRDEALAWLREE